MAKNLLLWLIVGIILIAVFSNLGSRRETGERLTYSQFLQSVEQGNITSVTIENQSITGTTRNNATFTTYMPIQDQYLLGELMKKGVNVEGKPPEQESFLMHLFINWFPMLLLIGVWVFF